MRGPSRLCSKNGTFFFRYSSSNEQPKCPSLLDLCIHRITEEMHNYNTFSSLPRDLTQQIFNTLVYTCCLTPVSFQAFRDCSLEDLYLGEYAGAVVNDGWMDVISSQGLSLLHVDLSGTDFTDQGLACLRDCKNTISLNLNYCHQISDCGLEYISGLSNLESLSFRRNAAISAQGLSNISGLSNLVKLDLERCPRIHGGIAHLQGLSKLESLNMNCCNCLTDVDMKPLSDLTNLKRLEISCNKVTDFGISFLKGIVPCIVLLLCFRTLGNI